MPPNNNETTTNVNSNIISGYRRFNKGPEYTLPGDFRFSFVDFGSFDSSRWDFLIDI